MVFVPPVLGLFLREKVLLRNDVATEPMVYDDPTIAGVGVSTAIFSALMRELHVPEAPAQGTTP